MAAHDAHDGDSGSEGEYLEGLRYEDKFPDPCGVVLGQQKGPGPGLFISCQNERPCPDHPTHSGRPCSLYTAKVWSPLSPAPEDDRCVNCGLDKVTHDGGSDG